MTLRRLAGAAALILLLAAAAPAGWGDLSRWVGRYPTDSDAHPAVRLFDIPAVRAGLDQVLGPADRNHLRALAVESPIERMETFLVVKQCMPHDCGSQNAMVVLDTTARRIWVGLFARTPAVTSTRWFGTSDHLDLPPDILQAFADQHRPR